MTSPLQNIPLPWPLPRALRGSAFGGSQILHPTAATQKLLPAGRPVWSPSPRKPLQYATFGDLLADTKLQDLCLRMGHDHCVATIPPSKNTIVGKDFNYRRHLEIQNATVNATITAEQLAKSDFTLVRGLHGVVWRNCRFNLTVAGSVTMKQGSTFIVRLFDSCHDCLFDRCLLNIDAAVTKLCEYPHPTSDGGGGGSTPITWPDEGGGEGGGDDGGGGGGSGGGGGGGGGSGGGGGGGATWPVPEDPAGGSFTLTPDGGLRVFALSNCDGLTIWNTDCSITARCSTSKYSNSICLAYAIHNCNSRHPKHFSGDDWPHMPQGIHGGRVGWRDSLGKPHRGGLTCAVNSVAEIVSIALPNGASPATALWSTSLSAQAVAEAFQGAKYLTPADTSATTHAEAIVGTAEDYGCPSPQDTQYIDENGKLRTKRIGLEIGGSSTASSYGFHTVLADLRPVADTATATALAVHPTAHATRGGAIHSASCTPNMAAVTSTPEWG